MIYFQKPNKSLLITLLFGFISFFTQQTVHVVSVIIAATAGTNWSFQEALAGVNNFRRLLGVLGFAFLAVYLSINFN
ncbi:MAG: hypothetical protein ACR2LN_03860 [Candidatus Levyibacteriota bacterium]